MLCHRSRCRLAAAVLAVGWLSLPASPTLADDLDQAARDSLRAAETAFAASAADRDQDRFRSFIADDAVFVGGGGPARGVEAIVAGWTPFFAPDGPTIEWRPESVEVVDGGLLGMSRGPYVVRSRDAEGAETSSTGTFFSVWRRASTDAPWRIVLDNGAPDKPCGDP